MAQAPKTLEPVETPLKAAPEPRVKTFGFLGFYPISTDTFE